MKILLCGEGAHDIGELERWSIFPDRQVEKPGWLQIVLRKILGRDDIEFIIVPRSRLVTLPKSARRPLPKGHGTKALISKFRGVMEKCDLVVFMVDADTNDKAEWLRKRQEVIDGFNAFDGEVKAVACVPMSASESWLLSDEAAWQSVGAKGGGILPKRPEEIWGARNDPDGRHPHCYFARICEDAEVGDCRETRVEIMEKSDVGGMAKKCPISFQAFLDDVAA